MEHEQLILDSLEKEAVIQRRKLLPIWIKIFDWIFIVFGALGVMGFIAGLFSARFEASLYEMETNDPSSSNRTFYLFSVCFQRYCCLWLMDGKKLGGEFRYSRCNNRNRCMCCNDDITIH